ncbi:MAG: T9SS type A sorting domain-containing protein [Flavobacteriales bacterium]|nr:T9SS type A sorting domain-containing protein [Flavobacteriales bacterium]
MKRILFSLGLVMLFLHSQALVKLTYVNPTTSEISITNFGSTTVDITNYRFCALFEYANLSQPTVSIVSGDFNLSPNETVTVMWNSSSGFNTTASDLGLYLGTGAFSSPSAMVDFFQYGDSGQGRENVAASAGLWTAGTFLTGSGPWYYIGNGIASGAAQWSSTLNVDVTFYVDMNNETVSPNGVHVVGDFQGWVENGSPMTDADADGVYEYTASVETNTTLIYTFLNGDTYAGQEAVPSTCGQDNGFGGYNRTLDVADVNIAADTVCFSSCSACEIIVEPTFVDVTFYVDMNNETVNANGVHVVGNFQNWVADGSPMTDADADGVYEYTASVETNTTLIYTFLNGDTYAGQEAVPSTCGQDNGFGGYNRTLDVADVNLAADTVCFSSCSACEIIVEPTFVDVTFYVDMNNETVNANGVHVVGNFQNWVADGSPMTDADADGVYEYTASVETNTTLIYTFLNGDTYAGQESVPSTCGQDNGFGGYNRTLDVADVNIAADTVCFSSCSTCEIIVEPTFVDVTFYVDMNNETVNANGVHVVGNFQNWVADGSPMTDVDADGVYEHTASVETNTTLIYTFLNGDTYAGQEAVPSTCGQDNGFGGYNRTLDVADVNIAADTVCFSSCSACEIIVEPTFVDVTFYVDMNNETVNANGVHVVGNFQNWIADGSPMTDVDADGVYEYTASVETNTTLIYTFLNGDTYAGQEAVPSACGQDNGFGGYNRTLDVADVNIAADTVCFSSCSACEIIVEPTFVDVTFYVDMNNETVNANGVHVVGNFQNWVADGSPMTDVDADGVYEYTASVETNTTLIYTFLNGDTYAGQEAVPSTCGQDNGFGGYNRTLDVADVNIAADTVCFSSCTACDIIVEPTFVDVTFYVDMNNETVNANGVHVVGNFQNWIADGSPMTDVDADGVYEYTASVETNTTLIYTFLNGDTYAGQEAVPSACGQDNGFGGYNRTLDVADVNIAADTVCFSSCTACDIIVEPTFVDVTFYVDMNNETVSANGVHIAGSFQNWNPATSEMTDVDQDGIYEYTASIDTTLTIQYVFINGNAWTGQEVVPSACGVSNGFGGYNRSLEIAEEDMILDVVCFATCEACIIVDPGMYDITFRVNMVNEVVDAAGVTMLAVSSLTPANQVALTDDNADGVYEVTLSYLTGDTIWYQFVNGDNFLGEEDVPSACGESYGIYGISRKTIVGEADVVLPVVCFNECANCVTSATNQITFLVNMNEQTVSPDGVHLVGNFQGWDPAATPMNDDDGDGVYSVTIETDEWANLSFKFINGNTFDGVENVPSTCGLPDGNGGYNRLLETGGVDITFGPVCFGSCTDCIINPATVSVTFLVNMADQIVDANGVHYAGALQGWDPSSSEMTDDDGDGIYEITLEAQVNTAQQFRFINGNDWPFGESVPAACGVDDGFGGLNRSVFVGVEDMTFGPVCFGACVDCEDVVIPTTVNVTFQVNMANETVSADGVHIAGSFQGWNPATTAMTDDNSDGIYEYTTAIDTNSQVLFVYINGNAWTGQEPVPSACGQDNGFGGYNRLLNVAEADTTYGPVCFSECEDCAPFAPVLVTFRVDMSNQVVNAEGVFMAGSFNNWDPTATQLSEYEPNHYQAVVVLNAGEHVNYKFLNGSDWTGAESVPVDCGEDDGSGNINRSYDAGTSNETVDIVCFNECSTCTVVNMLDITFQVDMGQNTISVDGIHLAGSFNAFSPTATPMTNTVDNVYTATVSVPENTQLTYKFINGSDFTGVESVPFACGVDDGFGGYNRSFTTNQSDVTLPEVCFSSCEDCPVGVGEMEVNMFTVYPIPAEGQFVIRMNQSSRADFRIFDSTGKLMMSDRLEGTITEVNVGGWTSGLYHVEIDGVGKQRIMVK